MLVTELGWAVTLLIGATLGFVGFAILIFWIQLFSKNFSADSKCFWPLFWVHQITWMVGVCVVPYDMLNNSFDTWAVPFMIYFFGSIVVMAIVKILSMR